MDEQQQSYDVKLAAILRAAAVVFAEKSFHEASIRDISRATGVSLSGLYYYFRSKEELLFLIQEQCFGAVLANLETLLQGVEDPHRRLRVLVENHLRFFVNNMQEIKVLSHEAETLRGEYRESVNAKKRRYTELCITILRDLAPSGRPIDERVAVFSLFGMMNWIYNWYRPGRDVPVAQLADDMSQLFLQGYLGNDGAELPHGATESAPGDARPSVWGS